MKNLLILCAAICLAFVSVSTAQKKAAAQTFTTSGYFNGIEIGPESGDPGGMSVFLTESNGQLYALVMTAAGDFNTPLLLEAKATGKDGRTIEFILPDENGYTVGGKYTGVVSAAGLTFKNEDGTRTLKRACNSLYSNITVGSGGDYGGIEVFFYDMAARMYALVTVAEGVLLRPVLVEADVKLSKDYTWESLALTLPGEGGSRKFKGKFTKTGLTLTEAGTTFVLKDKCYK